MPKYGIPPLEKPTLNDKLRRIVIVTNDLASSLEYVGVLQVLDEANYFLESAGRRSAYKVEVVTQGSGRLYECEGLLITASKTYNELEGGDIDTLIFQAIDQHDYCLTDKSFINWVTKMSTAVNRVVSICTGAFILAEAGVLDGRSATTHWAAAADFRSRYPKVQLNPKQIYVKDGHIYTAGGVTSGINLAIALVEEDLGAEVARRVSQGMVTFMKRPGDQSQFFASLSMGSSANSRTKFEQYILENIDKDLRLDKLADVFGMSLRNFNRHFRKQVGLPPGEFIEKCRVDYARNHLEQTNEPISKVATLSGFSSTNGLRLAFERYLGVSPLAYRKRFTTSI